MTIGLAGGSDTLKIIGAEGVTLIPSSNYPSGPNVQVGTAYTKITVSVQYNSIVVSNGQSSQSGLFTSTPGVLSYLMISNPTDVTIIGSVRNIKISGMQQLEYEALHAHSLTY